MSMMYTRNLVDLHLKYYTDNHDVDESVMAISMHGGYWVDHTFAGITHRDMGGTSSYVSSHVASKYNNKNSTLITGVEF